MKKFKIKKLFILLITIFLILITLFVIYNSKSVKKASDSSISDGSASSYYERLYGNWIVTKHIPSKIKTTLNSSVISFCIGQKFTIEKEKITSFFASISNPNIVEGVITASEFSNKYNDTFKNLGISGNEVKYVKISQTDKTNRSVTIFIDDDGKVYALLEGALFELEKQ